MAGRTLLSENQIFKCQTCGAQIHVTANRHGKKYAVNVIQNSFIKSDFHKCTPTADDTIYLENVRIHNRNIQREIRKLALQSRKATENEALQLEKLMQNLESELL